MEEEDIEVEAEEAEEVLIDPVPGRTMAQVLDHIAKLVSTTTRRDNAIISEWSVMDVIRQDMFEETARNQGHRRHRAKVNENR